ncbi:molybdate ABC transporter substrate-binding protein [Thalassotalea aquiviva]|uniref:molybdate ABC transporter substrate-binding protein n=1 Tax=Thalassotalea aquiviva TaxID=3242415 RepID=UPI00352A19F5
MVIKKFAFFYFLLLSQLQAETLHVAVASNFSQTLQYLRADFEQSHQVNLKISSAASGVLYQQIQHGAPFDLFLSADKLRPQLLQQANLTVNPLPTTYAIGQLALYSAQSKSPISLDHLQQYQGRLALANPALAPYGQAAKETLMSLGLWQQYQHRLILGSNINQTLLQLDSGAVEYGFISYNQLLETKSGFGKLIDNNYYQPIEQQMVILKSSSVPQLAQQFLDYMLSDKSQQILREHGYLTPHSPILVPSQHQEESP